MYVMGSNGVYECECMAESESLTLSILCVYARIQWCAKICIDGKITNLIYLLKS